MTLIPTEETQKQEDQEDQSNRPEFVEVQFWDEENKQVRLKEMAKALSDTQTQLRNNKDEMRREIEDEIKKGRPENPEGYKIEDLDIPKDSGFEIPEDDKLVERFRQFAYDTGLTNEQFKAAVSIYANNLIEGIPNPEKEIESLGENGRNRIDTLVRKAKGVLNDEEFQVFQGMAMTAKDIEVLEKLTKETRSGPSDFDRAEPQARDLEMELDKIMTSPEYLRGERYANERALDLSQQLARSRGRA